MIGPIRRTLTLIVLSVRDSSFGRAGGLAGRGRAGGRLLVARPTTPRRRDCWPPAPTASAYAEFGQRYAQALAKNHIQVKLLTIEGSLANLQALRAGDADVAFVRGGSDDPAADGEAGITSLGALFYEPLWVFYRPAALVKQSPAAPKSAASAPVSVTTLGQLRGLRVNIDQPGSGVPRSCSACCRPTAWMPAHSSTAPCRPPPRRRRCWAVTWMPWCWSPPQSPSVVQAACCARPAWR